MGSSEQSEASNAAASSLEQADETQSGKEEDIERTRPASLPTTTTRATLFDIVTLGIIIIIAASFAVTARLNDQPASSLVPEAVLSATGCGLLVTALRKLRTAWRPGLLKAGLVGLLVALVQFIAAISYPGVLAVLSTDPGQQTGFLATWGLVGVFSVIFAMAGAALGHLAFAPLRPLPARAKSRATTRDPSHPSPTPAPTEHDVTEIGITTAGPSAKIETPSRLFVNYLITVVLFGLAPTLVGVIFSAAFDYMLGVYQFTPGPYPTTRLLSAFLPWQIPAHLNIALSPNSIVLLLWRIPVFVGNPTAFDVQALEPFVFNGAALALLLLTMYRWEGGTRATTSVPAPTENMPGKKGRTVSWLVYLMLEGVLGLLLVLPADLWMLEGLQGILQVPSLNAVLPLPSIVILDQRAFVLNLITVPLVCLGMGLLLRESKPQRRI